jgi:hypothetical protein
MFFAMFRETNPKRTYRDGHKIEPDRVIEIANHRVLLFE